MRKPFLPSAMIGEGARGGHAELDVARVIERALGGEDLVDLRMLRFFHVDDDESLLAAGHVGVGAGDVDVARVFERHAGALNQARVRQRGDIQNFQSLAIHDEGVAELDGDALWIDEIGRADFRFHFRRDTDSRCSLPPGHGRKECRRRFRR